MKLIKTISGWNQDVFGKKVCCVTDKYGKFCNTSWACQTVKQV